MYKARINKAIKKIETNRKSSSQFFFKDGERNFIAEVYENPNVQNNYSIKVKKINGFIESELKEQLERTILSAIFKGKKIYILEDKGPECTLLPYTQYFEYNSDDRSVGCDSLTLHVSRLARFIKTNELKCQPDALLQIYFLYEIL